MWGSPRRLSWQSLRREQYHQRYDKLLGPMTPCHNCGEPVVEAMACCPWCGADDNTFDVTSRYELVCPRCHKGMRPEWSYCPWCYGGGFEPQKKTSGKRGHVHGKCRYCKGPLERFMKYCPWCRRKVTRPWRAGVLPEMCPSCTWPVDSEYWDYCPWCGKSLVKR